MGGHKLRWTGHPPRELISEELMTRKMMRREIMFCCLSDFVGTGTNDISNVLGN